MLDGLGLDSSAGGGSRERARTLAWNCSVPGTVYRIVVLTHPGEGLFVFPSELDLSREWRQKREFSVLS